MTRPKSYGDAFFVDCPTREVLDLISGKWVCLIVVALADRPSGYRELLRRIEGVSPKVLTETLRRAERDGLVDARRPVTAGDHSDYRLTELGRTLLPVLEAVKAWSEEHLPEIREARHRAADGRGELPAELAQGT